MKTSMNFHTKHFIVIFLSLLVFVGLMFVDRTSLETSKSSDVQKNNPVQINQYLFSSLDEITQKDFQQLENKLKNEELPSKKIELLTQLVSLAINKKLFDYAIYYQKALVDLVPNDNEIAKLGDFALIILDSAPLDSAKYVYYHEIASQTFKQLLNKDKENLQWKVKLAITKVKSKDSGKIMEGIRDLVEITQKNENHFEANYYLGLFSLESNQPEKAIKRFEKCLKVQPENSELWLGLGDAYQMLNQKLEALKSYETALKYSKEEQQKIKILKKLESVKL